MSTVAAVTRTELFHLVASEATTMPVQVDMSYTEADPWAVRFTFRSGHDIRVVWTFGRALLAAGLTHNAGEGDVRIRPNTQNRASLVLEVHAPEGHAEFTASAPGVAEFLDATYRVAGPEHARDVVEREFEAFDWSPA